MTVPGTLTPALPGAVGSSATLLPVPASAPPGGNGPDAKAQTTDFSALLALASTPDGPTADPATAPVGTEGHHDEPADAARPDSAALALMSTVPALVASLAPGSAVVVTPRPPGQSAQSSAPAPEAAAAAVSAPAGAAAAPGTAAHAVAPAEAGTPPAVQQADPVGGQGRPAATPTAGGAKAPAQLPAAHAARAGRAPASTHPAAPDSAASGHQDNPSLPAAASPTTAAASPTTSADAGSTPAAVAQAGAAVPITPVHSNVTTAVEPIHEPVAHGVAEQPQLSQALSHLRARGNGSHELTVMLHPAELGAVHVRATLHDGALTVTVACADDAARQAVTAALPDLHHALGGLGTVDLDLRNAGGGQRDSAGSRPGNDPSAGGQRDPMTNGDAGGQHRRRSQDHSGANPDDRLDQWM